MLLADLLGTLRLEDPLDALVLEPLGLDFLEVLDLGLGVLLGGGVGVALVLQIVLLVLELLAQLLEVGSGDGVLVHRRRRAVRRRGHELVGDHLVGGDFRAFEDRHRRTAGGDESVDRHLLGGATQFLEIGDEGVVLRLQIGDLLVDRFEVETRLGPGRRRGVGPIASRLDLGGGASGGVIVALGGCRHRQAETDRRNEEPGAGECDEKSNSAPGHGASVAHVFQLGDDHDEPATV